MTLLVGLLMSKNYLIVFDGIKISGYKGSAVVLFDGEVKYLTVESEHFTH